MLKSKITREISESSMPRHKCTALCIGRLLDELFLQDVQISGKAFSILLISLRMLRIALGERRSNIFSLQGRSGKRQPEMRVIGPVLLHLFWIRELDGRSTGRSRHNR